MSQNEQSKLRHGGWFPPKTQRYSVVKHCPSCGNLYGGDDFHREECLFLCAVCGYDFYQNPVPAAVSVVADPQMPNALLLLKRNTSPGKGLWCVPGGFIRYGELPADAAAREVVEETGLVVTIDGVLRAGLVDYRYGDHQMCIVEIAFLAHPKHDAVPARATHEALEIRYWSLEELLAQPDILAFPEQLQIFLSYRRYLAGVGFDAPERGM